MNNFFYNLKLNSRFVLVSGFFLASLSFAVGAFLPVQYSSTVDVLIIQKQPDDKVDAFSAAKSAEYLSGIFMKVVYTDKFFQELFSAPFKIENNFPSDQEEWQAEWARSVKTRKINNTGIIEITALADSRAQAKNLAGAIAWNLSQTGQQYHGGGDRVEIKLIDGPITPKDPAWPKIWLNLVIGFLVGLLVAGLTIYFFPESAFLRKKKIRNNFSYFANTHVDRLDF